MRLKKKYWICQRVRKLALCKACNKPLTWKQPYKKGDRPVEKDGSVHNCPKWKGKNEEKITNFKVFEALQEKRKPFFKEEGNE